jgi:iron complex outermembrane receptor protein
VSGFYYDYKDLQVQYYQNAAAVTTNAAASTIYGAEANLTQRVTNEFTVSGGVAYTHARYDQYPGAPAGVFSYTTGLITNAPSINAAGNTLSHAPEWTGNVSASYVTPLFEGDLALNANEYFTSKFYFDPSNTHSQGAYGLLNLKASWTTPSRQWTFSLWGNNVTDTKYITQVLSGTYETETTWGLPATYGLAVKFKY